jgi:hypothetical protein
MSRFQHVFETIQTLILVRMRVGELASDSPISHETIAGVIFRTILVQVFSPKMGQWFSAIGGQSFSAKLGQGGGGEAPSQQAYLLFSRQRGQEAVCLERGRRPWISERC